MSTDHPGHIGTCPTCGKRCFNTRKQARKVARRLKDQPHMSAYKCVNWWHLGHLPKPVIEGKLTRDNLTRRNR